MELFSQKFRNEVVKSFFETSNRLFIIATIPQMHKIPQQHSSLFQKFRTDEKCKIITKPPLFVKEQIKRIIGVFITCSAPSANIRI
ncbi:hypothetical protein E2986_02547 [Frieseomelitta varia]|uniref:Uncharacterized protein n=1 Tax=Frieseomelitta varia TaxID=561572 RepID=A0A833W6J5_9HYME|nr:hypothetical protein E2986_02547 [Frieseomelitta varia]